MSTPLVHISEDLFSVLAEQTLITPNERLARAFQKAFEQLAGDRFNSWRKPEILSFRQWQTENYHRLCEHKPHLPRLLNPNELIVLAHRVMPHRLPTAMVRNMLNNWHALIQYQIPPGECAGHELFSQWARGLSQVLAAANEISSSHTCELLLLEQHIPRNGLIFTEIEELTATEQDYLQMLCQQGSVSKYCDGRVQPTEHVSGIRQIPEPPTGRESRKVLAAPTISSEWQAAARWAMSVKLKDPSATIAIVVPELEHHYQHCAFEIGRVLDPASGSRSATFDISGGRPLVEQPVWQHAAMFLAALLAPAEHRSLSRLTRSPFIRLDAGLQHAIAKSGRLVNLPSLLTTGTSEQCQRLTELVSMAGSTTGFSDSLGWFLQVLRAVSWPGLSNVESHQYQAWQRILVIFQELSARPGTEPLEHCFAVTNHALTDTIFAPQRPTTDIQVLGALETTGLRFSHVWVCHADANRFPNQYRGFSYIPNSIAQSHGIPRTSQQAEIDFARRLFANWSDGGKETRFSYTALAEDAPQHVTPLLKGSRVAATGDEPRWQRQNIKIEAWHDDSGPPLQGQPRSTGVGLLESYARCPFQSFARFRLNVDREREPPLLADHLDRGNLAHRVLQLVLEHGPDQNQLNRLAAKDIESAMDRALAELDRPLPDRFVAYERSRLAELITDWLELEKGRQPFRVVETEQRYRLALEPFDLNIRIDRLDEVDGDYLVIDYKTGRTTLQGVLGEELSNVQLPIYALLDDRIGGVAYAELGQSSRLHGIGNGTCRDIQSVDDWTETKSTWAKQVNKIANEFTNGRAEVTPSSAEVCRYCHLHSFCRVDES